MLEHLATFFASWYDPSDNGFDIGDALTACLVVAAVYGGMIASAKIVRAWDAKKDRRHRMDVEAIMKPHLDALDQRLVEQTTSLAETIREATKPIQPTTNGGLSLPDVHVTLARIEEKVGAIDGRVGAIEEQAVVGERQRSAILRIGAKNATAITDGFAALGAEIELLPFDKPDDHH